MLELELEVELEKVGEKKKKSCHLSPQSPWRDCRILWKVCSESTLGQGAWLYYPGGDIGGSSRLRRSITPNNWCQGEETLNGWPVAQQSLQSSSLCRGSRCLALPLPKSAMIVGLVYSIMTSGMRAPQRSWESRLTHGEGGQEEIQGLIHLISKAWTSICLLLLCVGWITGKKEVILVKALVREDHVGIVIYTQEPPSEK